MERRLFVLQRLLGMALGPLVVVHLGVVLYALARRTARRQKSSWAYARITELGVVLRDLRRCGCCSRSDRTAQCDDRVDEPVRERR